MVKRHFCYVDNLSTSDKNPLFLGQPLIQFVNIVNTPRRPLSHIAALNVTTSLTF
jgi:hypothetical protein